MFSTHNRVIMLSTNAQQPLFLYNIHYYSCFSKKHLGMLKPFSTSTMFIDIKSRLYKQERKALYLLLSILIL